MFRQMELQDETHRRQSRVSCMMTCMTRPLVNLVGLVASVSIAVGVKAMVVEVMLVKGGEPLSTLIVVVALMKDREHLSTLMMVVAVALMKDGKPLAVALTKFVAPLPISMAVVVVTSSLLVVVVVVVTVLVLVAVVVLIKGSKMTACHQILKLMTVAVTKFARMVEVTHMVEAENNRIVLAKVKARLDKSSSYQIR